jgi:Bacterial Ig-like domain (group 3)
MTLFSTRRASVLLCLVASAVTWWLFAGVAQAAPINTGLPTISGNPQEGQTLTAQQATWADTADPTITVTDAWESCAGATCAAVGSGTTYIVAAADVGNTIQVVETATTATDGSTTITSTPTAAVIALQPANTSLPTISGTAQDGKVLTLTQGQWSGNPTITDQWEDCTGAACTPTGQTGTTYALTAGDVGHTIDVLETATNTGGATAIHSAQIGPVAALPPANTALPTITGTAQEGRVLTLAQGQWTNSPAIADQWEDCTGAACSPISGQTGATYTVGPSDVGHTIEVLETATNTGGTAQASSLPTVQIVAPPTEISAPSISGTPQQGSPLTESHGTWTGSPTSYSIQWERCIIFSCTAIAGATRQSYTPTADDLGAAILVEETAINAGGPSAPANSAVTGLVANAAGIVPAPTSTSLVVSPSGPLTNQTVTLVATISSGSGRANPSGSVTFLNGFNAISGCTNEGFEAADQSATVICRGSFPAGTARLTAVYRPSPGLPLLASASQLTTLNVGRDPTSTSLAVTKQVVRGKRATYTATVGLPISNSGPLEPTGSIEFLDGGRPVPGCLSRPLARLAATCTIKYKRRGTHKISARYAGDSNFASSTSPARPVQIVKHSSQPIVLGFISSTLEWQFFYHRTYTQVTALRADRLVKGITVQITCNGRACPFSRRSIAAKTSTSINLLPAFHKRHLRVGSQITLRIMRPNWIGKYYSFTVRAGRGPLISLSCLGIGRSRPGLGC